MYGYKFETIPTFASPSAKLRVDEDSQDISPVVSLTSRLSHRAASIYVWVGNMVPQLRTYYTSILSRIPHVQLTTVINTLLYSIAVALVLKHVLAEIAHWNEPLEPPKQQVVHFAYELTVVAYWSATESLWYQKQWEHSGLDEECATMEQCAWSDIERTLRGFEKEYGEERFSRVEMDLKRRKVVFDIYEDRDGTYPVEIPQDNDGADMFGNVFHFEYDANSTSAYIEELDDALPDEAQSGEVGAQH
ncbi:hypothetical protein FRC08_004627 [Ceratobasidium sp. 394]|nr:hypothetical protein FRC08_004627 [Ceratobasidium sp. 394]